MPHARFWIATLCILAFTARAPGGGLANDCATALPLADQGELVIVLSPDVPVGATVTGVTLSFRAAHEWIGDLTVSLDHGELGAMLIDRPGSGDFSFGCGGEFIDVLVTDSPVAGGPAPCTPDNPEYTGEVAPVEPLSVFLGEQASGGWAVTVRDVQQFDIGTIEEVCLEVVFESAACAGDCDASGAVNFADLVSMLFEFGTPGSSPSCDADGSGSVNFADLVSALFLFGPCP